MKKALSFILFLFFIFAGTQITIPDNFSGSKTQLEEMIVQEEKLANDSTVFQNQLLPLSKHHDKKLQSFYHIFLANSFSAEFDALNSKSNDHYKKGLEFAKESGDQALLLWANTQYVFYLYKFRNYQDIINPLLFVINESQRIPERKLLQPFETFRLIGWTLSTFKDHEDALINFEKAKTFTKTNSKEHADVLNYIGNSYLSLGQTDKAEKNFERAVTISQNTGNLSRLAKSLGYLADIQTKKGKTNEAIELLKKDIKISEEARDNQNTMFALIQLSKIYMSLNNSDEAFRWLQAAKSISESKSYYKSSEKEILTLELQIIQQNPVKINELDLRRRLQVLDDSLKKTDGEMQISRANWMIQKSKYDHKIDETKVLASRQSLFKNIFLFLAVASLIALIFFYFDRRKLQKNRILYLNTVREFQEEKENLEKLLNSTKLDYENQIEYISKKNEQITLLRAELENYKEGQFKKLEYKSRKLNDLLESHLMTEENWLNFKNAYKEYDAETFSKFNNFTEITESNLRIILLQKLGYGNTEIAGLLGITPDAVKKSKQRLRKKLGDKNIELDELLAETSFS